MEYYLWNIRSHHVGDNLEEMCRNYGILSKQRTQSTRLITQSSILLHVCSSLESSHKSIISRLEGLSLFDFLKGVPVFNFIKGISILDFIADLSLIHFIEDTALLDFTNNPLPKLNGEVKSGSWDRESRLFAKKESIEGVVRLFLLRRLGQNSFRI